MLFSTWMKLAMTALSLSASAFALAFAFVVSHISLSRLKKETVERCNTGSKEGAVRALALGPWVDSGRIVGLSLLAPSRDGLCLYAF